MKTIQTLSDKLYDKFMQSSIATAFLVGLFSSYILPLSAMLTRKVSHHSLPDEFHRFVKVVFIPEALGYIASLGIAFVAGKILSKHNGFISYFKLISCGGIFALPLSIMIFCITLLAPIHKTYSAVSILIVIIAILTIVLFLYSAKFVFLGVKRSYNFSIFRTILFILLIIIPQFVIPGTKLTEAESRQAGIISDTSSVNNK